MKRFNVCVCETLVLQHIFVNIKLFKNIMFVQIVSQLISTMRTNDENAALIHTTKLYQGQRKVYSCTKLNIQFGKNYGRTMCAI